MAFAGGGGVVVDLVEAKKLADSLKDTTFVRGGIDFIPTPPRIAFEMAHHLDLRGGEIVLEPSAGSGALVDAILDLRDDVEIWAIETNYNACCLLWDKHPIGGQVVVWQYDFMEWERAKYSRIIMNPPWSNNKDAKHVLHAWDECLADDGILVALVSKGVMWRRDKATRRLRSLIHDEGEILGPVMFREPPVAGMIIRLLK